MIIIHKPSRKKLTYSNVKEGMPAAKARGMTTREMEVALGDHLDGANKNERQKVYEDYFTSKQK